MFEKKRVAFSLWVGIFHGVLELVIMTGRGFRGV